MKKPPLLILSIVCVVCFNSLFAAASIGFLLSHWHLGSNDKEITDPLLTPSSVLNTPMPNFSLMASWGQRSERVILKIRCRW